MTEYWIQKAKVIKTKGERVWDGSKGEYRDSSALTVEEIAAYLKDDADFEYMSDMKELDDSE
ncbi:MAG: hypothetical protein K2Y22_15880 [Candidatus Obscuribacterales bacterium]|nr:hypothetical protein [Candidatus Obscuribacterales bacterium]